MNDWETESHATCTVTRNESGTIRFVKCRAEYYEDQEDQFAEGVAARFKFDVIDGEIAQLVGVKEIEDGAPTGYDTSLDFVRTIPIAEQAVWEVPDIEEVHSTEADISDELDRGRRALE